MPVQPDWGALRRPLRSCAIGALGLFGFLSVWQLVIPGDNSGSLVGWAFILATAISYPSGIGLAVSASRRIWRSGQRRRAALPLVLLCVSAIALPMTVRAAGASVLLTFATVPLVLVLSAAFSAYLIVTANPTAPVPTRPTDFNTDEPHAYVSDIPRKRTSG